MNNNIAFIGGIHGVGKSTACKSICDVTGLIHLTASTVLKWNEIKQGAEKIVADINATQNRLIEGLKAVTGNDEKYLLDGHYCLLNKMGKVQPVPIETFIQIAPYLLSLLIEDASIIQSRLENRDKKPYGINLLNEMQDHEISHAQIIAKTLDIELIIARSGDTSQIINSLKHKL